MEATKPLFGRDESHIDTNLLGTGLAAYVCKANERLSMGDVLYGSYYP